MIIVSATGTALHQPKRENFTAFGIHLIRTAPQHPMQTVTETTGSASTGLPPLLSATQPRAVTSNFAHELAGMGYTTVELKRAGFTAKEIITGSPSGAFDASALLLAGYSVAELKDAGFAASQLRTAGACDITLDSRM